MQAYFWQANAKYFFAKCVSLFWILKGEEGWGEIEISTKGVVDRREEGGGRGRGKENMPARSHCSFGKIRSWAKGDSDWCGVALNG